MPPEPRVGGQGMVYGGLEADKRKEREEEMCKKEAKALPKAASMSWDV